MREFSVYDEDRLLVSRMLAGDQRAFDAFYKTHSANLRAFLARRAQLEPDRIDDLVQKTLIKAMRNLRGFRGESALFTWLCTICRRELLNMLQREEPKRAHESLDHDDAREFVLSIAASDEHEPPQIVERLAHRHAVASTLNRLPQRYAQALAWKYGEDSSIREIATRLAVTPLAAQSLLMRARRAFKASWQEDAPSETRKLPRSFA